MTGHSPLFHTDDHYPHFEPPYSLKPNTYKLIIAQCDLSKQMTTLLESFTQSGDPDIVDEVRQLQARGDQLHQLNLDRLSLTPLSTQDRANFHQACSAVHAIQKPVGHIIEELARTSLQADWPMLEMTVQLQQAMNFICDGYQTLATRPIESIKSALLIINLRQSIEKSFRSSLAHLMNKEQPTSPGFQSAHQLVRLFDLFKQREIHQLYRDASIQVGQAGQILHKIAIEFI